jgi:hypothetical protein
MNTFKRKLKGILPFGVSAITAGILQIPSVAYADGDALNILTVGANAGQRAVERYVPTSPSPYGAADHLGSTVTHVSGPAFNAMSAAQLATYDVVLTQWATADADLDLASAKVIDYVFNGGNLFLDGDYGNFNDLSWLGVSGATTFCSGPWSFTPEADPVFTDSVSTTPTLSNCHGYFPNYDTTAFKVIMRDGSGNAAAIAAKYGGGRVLATGPDHDYHATPGSEQYQVLLNELSWVGSVAIPRAAAGLDVAVDEGAEVMLDGSGSSYEGDETLVYTWTQIAGTPVTLSDPNAVSPSFTAPLVEAGGETLTFRLTLDAGDLTDNDTVSVSVIDVFNNHQPVADAGDDQSVAEGAPVALDGSNSFDIDGDVITFSWTQVSGAAVSLNNATTATPNFTAPLYEVGGAVGVVDTLIFELTVDDGLVADSPADGYNLGDNVSTVTVEITNINNPPVADAGLNQTINENTMVYLTGAASSDPDGDLLTFAWSQTSGTPVTLDNPNSDSPSFVAPFVSTGGETLTFELVVDDGFGGSDAMSVDINVQNENDPPNASLAFPSVECMWPPKHNLVEVQILGVTDPNDNATIVIDGVTQDEPTNGLGDGDTATDAIINDDGSVLLRAERSGKGDGRIYKIAFTASDIEGSDSGVVEVCVPHSRKSTAVDSGEDYDSTL